MCVTWRYQMHLKHICVGCDEIRTIDNSHDKTSWWINIEECDFCVFCSLEEECDAPLCTPALMSKNHELQNDIKKLTAVFDKLKSYISLLALPSRYHITRVQLTLSEWFMTVFFCRRSFGCDVSKQHQCSLHADECMLTQPAWYHQRWDTFFFKITLWISWCKRLKKRV